MRTFLALTPDPASCRAIDAWRQRCWPVISRAVPAQNYHITLTFLGELSAPKVDQLQNRIAGIRHRPFELRLDRIGYWPDARCLWLGPTQTCQPLVQLAANCATAANRVGVSAGKKHYSPHLTLARSVDLPPAPALEPPEFILEINRFFLYQSLLERSAAHYIELANWPL